MPFLGGFSPTLVHAQPNVFNIAVIKSLATESITIAEASHVRLIGKTRAPASQTITIGEAIAELITKLRALSDTTNIAELVLRAPGRVKLLSPETIIIGDSITKLLAKVRDTGYSHITGETLGNLISKVRSLAAQNTTISDTVDKLVGVTGAAIEKSLADTILITHPAIGRLKAVWRLQPP